MVAGGDDTPLLAVTVTLCHAAWSRTLRTHSGGTARVRTGGNLRLLSIDYAYLGVDTNTPLITVSISSPLSFSLFSMIYLDIFYRYITGVWDLY